MSIRRPRFDEEEAAQAINISPLIDVIFILLIFFIVTMVFADGAAMNIDVPEASNSQNVDVRTATITISSDGKIKLDGKVLELANLAGELKRRFMESPSLIVRSDVRVSVSRLVEVMDCAKGAGAQEIYVAADRKKK